MVSIFYNFLAVNLTVQFSGYFLLLNIFGTTTISMAHMVKKYFLFCKKNLCFSRSKAGRGITNFYCGFGDDWRRFVNARSQHGQGVVHQIVSPISNSESTNFCNEYLLWSSFSTGKLRNSILLPKLFWPTVRKNCSSDREKLLKFEAEGWELAKLLRSLKALVVKNSVLHDFGFGKVSQIHKTFLMELQLFGWRHFSKTEVVQNTVLNH